MVSPSLQDDNQINYINVFPVLESPHSHVMISASSNMINYGLKVEETNSNCCVLAHAPE